MATPTSKDRADVGRIEHELAQVRGDLGRTVQEIGTRLTPAHIVEQARRTLRESTVETTKAVAQSATDMASDVAARTRDVAMDVALDARDRVQAHPYVVGAVGAGIGLGYWLTASTMRKRRRLVPREWDEPFDRSSRRTTAGRRISGAPRAFRLVPLAATAAAAWLLWTTNRA